MEEKSVVCFQIKIDCISIRNKDGLEEKVQKRLRLANISEIYTNFKEELPGLKAGFSAFALQWPKLCMSVWVAGSHNVCICTNHQNIKLMLFWVVQKIQTVCCMIVTCALTNQWFAVFYRNICSWITWLMTLLNKQ